MQDSKPEGETSLRSGHLAAFQNPDTRRSLWQIANSVLPFLGLWVVMIYTLSISYWLTLAVAVIAAGFLVRVFIIFHDCGHGSFFRSRRANDFVGFITGLLTLTPHFQWWRQHSLHHASNGNLNRRGHGDVWTLTVAEYQSASWWEKIRYRCVRQPLFMLTVGPLVMFAVLNRFPTAKARRRERLSVLWTNLALVAILVPLVMTIGLKAYLMIHLPVILFSGAAGIWLFYVQHQFEGVYWQRQEGWDFTTAALRGSSFYNLPRVLQWFSGNIGFHHVHHLNPMVPNYFLEACHRGVPALHNVQILTLKASFRCLSLRLWDEQRQKLVGYKEMDPAR